MVATRHGRLPAIIAAILASGSLSFGLTACGSDERVLTEEESALLADEKYGPTTFEGANVGGVMTIDDDTFRLGVVSSDGEKAQLEVLHSTDRELNTTTDVEYLSVFTVGEYRIQVVTVGERTVAVEWAKAQQETQQEKAQQETQQE